jgi:hypothetical protein
LSICKEYFTFIANIITMSSKLLLPNKYKKIGWCLLIPAALLGIFMIATDFDINWLNVKVFAFLSDSQSFSLIKDNITNEIVGVSFIVGALFVGFSREKREDEFIANLRLSSLLWAVYVNYILLILSFLFVYGAAFLSVMMYNMFTVMIIFIGRFNYILYKNSKSVPDEK